MLVLAPYTDEETKATSHEPAQGHMSTRGRAGGQSPGSIPRPVLLGHGTLSSPSQTPVPVVRSPTSLPWRVGPTWQCLAHQPHRRVSSPGWGWLPLSWAPTHTNNPEMGLQRVQRSAKRLPSSPLALLSHSITILGHRHSPSPGGHHPGPGPSQQATLCPG